MFLKIKKKYKNSFKFFIADKIFFPDFRNIKISSIEYPFFSLKNKDLKVRKYSFNNINVVIRPSVDIGIATIFDRDILIYAISKLYNSINNFNIKNRTVHFNPYDFFSKTNRNKSGRSYLELENILNRLSNTKITTNIFYSKNNFESFFFNLIDNWKYLKYRKGKSNFILISITLPKWLCQTILKNGILNISPKYFLIRKATYRRIYEIAHKYCNNKFNFEIDINKLYFRIGTLSSIFKFKYIIKKLSKINNLPDYTISFDYFSNSVIFNNRYYL